MLARYVLCKPQHRVSAQSEADLIIVVSWSNGNLCAVPTLILTISHQQDVSKLATLLPPSLEEIPVSPICVCVVHWFQKADIGVDQGTCQASGC